LSDEILRYAAIDAGSNAVRLLMCNVVEEHGELHYKKSEFIRIPLRLGEDVFHNGKISSRKSGLFIKTMHAFKLLIDVFDPIAYRACATSSMREAENGLEVIDKVRKLTGLRMEIIDGKEEAELIYSNHIEQLLDHDQSYLYIDVGGGSTEITLFDHGKIVVSRSFNIGTIRWLKEKITKESWEEMKSWVRESTSGHFPITAIGSGGNINKIFKLLEKKDKSIEFSRLKELYNEMKVHTITERMEIWQLNPDRADVILPAAKIYLGVMRAAGIQQMIVPQIGLADGIIHSLHESKK
jgi:exopolyphosphatase/guanosine-5'-triphosphate,3'-diphosphate pyrophosphatase